MNDFLYHHGILGQKWGVRNGPPYPLEGKRVNRHGYKLSKKGEKKYTISAQKRAQTLSYDKERLSGADMYFASLTNYDKAFYKKYFNQALPNDEKDEYGKPIGPSHYLKWNIVTSANKEINVANEREGIEAFIDLIEKDRDFYNFVLDRKRMASMIDERRASYKGYAEALSVYDSGSGEISDDQAAKLYRLFNYAIPNDSPDAKRQRAKFFRELSDRGYGALLDTNDAIYGKFKMEQPVIIFDMDSIDIDDIYRTSDTEKTIAQVQVFLQAYKRLF